MEREPRISIVTAVLNRADVVGDAIESLARQTCERVEHLIVDGGSTDGTLEIVRRKRQESAEVICQEGEGIYDALNTGIARARGTIIGVLHSDDVFAHDRVLEDVAVAFEDHEVDAVYGDLVYVKGDNTSRVLRVWRAGSFTKGKLRRGWMPPHPALFLRKRVFKALGMYDVRYAISGDYEAVLRYFGSGRMRKVRYLPQVMVAMRTGGVSNRSLGRIIQKSREDYRAIKAHNVGGIGVLIQKNVRKWRQFVTAAEGWRD